jgi:predicted nucleotide-binding protein (sugar kinase/HSP70/actin superfamily)
MHPVGNRFFVAAFRSEGYDARTLPLEDEGTHSLGKKWTRGAECLPMSLTLGAFLNQVESDRRAGEGSGDHPALFLPTSTGPCRYGQYRTLDRLIFERLKMEDIPILSPGAHNAYYGLPGRLRRRAWEGICGGDSLFKMRCRVLPNETTKGDTEEVLERTSRRAEDLIVSKHMDWPAFLEGAMVDFLRIPVRPRRRPLVGIVGEIYVRCNPFANSRIVDTIEKLGGEVWLSPISEWILYTAWVERYLARRRGLGPLKSLPLALKWRYFTGTEKAMTRRLGPLLGDRTEPSMDEIMRAGSALLPPEFQGESIVSVGRAILFGEAGADLVVNCAPFGCMHGNITSAVFEQSGDRTRAPVVNVSYDGTGDNAVLNAFMHEARRRKG